jgi:hypothetical protein
VSNAEQNRLDRRLPQAPLQQTIAGMPDRPPRLHLVFQKYDPPLYFVTFNTHRRRILLANARVHSCLIEFAKPAEQRGIALGRYAIMPDHVHLFAPNRNAGAWHKRLYNYRRAELAGFGF